MSAHKKLQASDLKRFDLAAAGHDGVLTDKTGSLLIKPCTPLEVAFYESSLSRPRWAKWLPTFYGTLSLSDPAIDSSGTGSAAGRTTSIVLSNAVAGFKCPCVLDIKLGAQLWDEGASEEKRARLDKVSDETTSRPLGMRIAGMKVWKGGEYRVYDKMYGRTFSAATVIEGVLEYFSAPIGAANVKMLAERFAAKVREVQKTVEEMESRMFSASLLFVYEGDKVALEEAVAREKVWESRESVEEEEEEEPKVEVLKLIDFAHATWTPGEGMDENALQGIRSAGKLLEEVAEKV